MGRRPEQTFFQRRYTNVHRHIEKIVNITNHQRNANQNHNKTETTHRYREQSSSYQWGVRSRKGQYRGRELRDINYFVYNR